MSESRRRKAGPISNVVCPDCKRSLDDVIESLIRQRGKFKGQREEARNLLRDVAASGVSFEDPRGGYVEVQIDRVTWEALAAYRGPSS